jgi:hypothetical protein
MSRYSETARDDNGVAIPGVSVYVFEWGHPPSSTGTLSPLTDDDLTTPLPNPLTTDEYGQFYFNTTLGVKLVEYHFAGKLLYREQIILTPTGSYPGNDAALRDDLAAVGGVSLVAGAAKTDLSNITGANRLLTDDNLFNPIGNGNNTRGRFNLIAADSRNDIREFMFSLGADFSHGTAGSGTGGAGEKALLYLGATMQPGSYKAWTLNPLLHIAAGAAVEYANVAEFDIDNYSGGNFGAGIGAAGLSAPSVWGLTLNGANPGSNTITGAIGLISSAAGPIYERGFVAGPNAVKQAAFDDYSSATYSHRDLGSHSVGVELRGTYSVAAMRIPSGKPIVARNVGDTANISLMTTDGTNQIVIGDPTNAINVVLANHVLPEADATRQIGSATKKYAEVHVQRLVAYPPASVTPATNGELRIEATSNTTLTFRYKGSDGTVRSGTLTLS